MLFLPCCLPCRHLKETAMTNALDCLDTPSLLLDRQKLKANTRKLLHLLREKSDGVKLRPHCKGVKAPALARLFLAEGGETIEGICVAKTSEAEVMVAAGITDILITTEVIGKNKTDRLMKLAALCPDLKVVADSRALVENLVSACKEAMLPQSLKVLVEINVGQNRTGVEPGEEALQLAQFISQMPELKLVGLQGYEGHLQHLCPASERERLCREAMEKLTATTKLMRDHGLAPEIVTTGGTGTFLTCAAAEGVTEVQPGSFALMDTAYTDALAGAYENALTVMTTVLGVYRDRIVVDAGLKSLSTDMGFARPFKQLSAQGSEDGLPLAHLTYTPGGDEHGILKAGQDGTLPDLKPGDRLLLIPSHCDTTLNLYDTLYLSEPGQEVEAVPILARGKVQ